MLPVEITMARAINNRHFKERIWFSLIVILTVLCLVLSGCRRPTPDSYWRDAGDCLNNLRVVEQQLNAGRSHIEVAPYMVKAKITIDDFQTRYKEQGIEELNREIKLSLDAYLDAFTIDDTIYLNRPILPGSLIGQQLTTRYPEVADRKRPDSGEVDAPAILPIVRQKALQHAETARKLLEIRQKDAASNVGRRIADSRWC